MNSQKGFAPLIIIIVVVVIAVGIIGYLWMSKGGTSPESISKLIPHATPTLPVKGCGNGICEADETFDSCPADCNLPSTIEPYIAKISLSIADLPPPLKDTNYSPPKDTQWSKILDKIGRASCRERVYVLV